MTDQQPDQEPLVTDMDAVMAFGAPDDSLCGEPLDLHINDGVLHPTVAQSTHGALANPEVAIIARRYHAMTAQRADVEKFRSHQARLLRAWRAKTFPDLPGRLSLRTRTGTDSNTGTDWRWVYVTYEPKYRTRKAPV